MIHHAIEEFRTKFGRDGMLFLTMEYSYWYEKVWTIVNIMKRAVDQTNVFFVINPANENESV
jgi:hypothetical protein